MVSKITPTIRSTSAAVQVGVLGGELGDELGLDHAAIEAPWLEAGT